jgi:transcriptional regulator with XRE-family HTH domain
MGSPRPRPELLAAKLRKIRLELGLSQQAMATKVAHKRSPVYPGRISDFEQDVREPSLMVLLNYSRTARIGVDKLIDDDVKVEDLC